MLDLINLAFDYQELPVLKQINFHLGGGDLLHLKGANGAGKTTLLKLIAGLYRPHQGKILYSNQDISQNLAYYQTNLCYVGHKTGINPYLSVKENCMFDLQCSDGVNLTNLLSVFGLHAHIDQPCALLSAGQKRQIGLLRLWMSKAKLWLLDEPLVALDERSQARVMDKIASHRALGGAVIVTSHQPLPLQQSLYQEYSLC